MKDENKLEEELNESFEKIFQNIDWYCDNKLKRTKQLNLFKNPEVGIDEINSYIELYRKLRNKLEQVAIIEIKWVGKQVNKTPTIYKDIRKAEKRKEISDVHKMLRNKIHDGSYNKALEKGEIPYNHRPPGFTQ